jgi:hypothetical protein
MKTLLPLPIIFCSVILSSCSDRLKWEPGLPKVKNGNAQQIETTTYYLKGLYDPKTSTKTFFENAKQITRQGGLYLPTDKPDLLMNSAVGMVNSPAAEGDEYVYSPMLGGLKKHTDSMIKKIILNINENNVNAIEEIGVMLDLAMSYTMIGNPQSYVQGEYILSSILKVLNRYPEISSLKEIRAALKETERLKENQIRTRANEYQALLTYMYRDYKSGNEEYQLDWELCAQGIEIIKADHSLNDEQVKWEKLMAAAKGRKDTKSREFLGGVIVEMIIALNPEQTGTLELQNKIFELGENITTKDNKEKD